MIRFFKNNSTYFSLLAIFFACGLIAIASTEYGDLIRFFSARRTVAGDTFFKFATHLGEEKAYLFWGVAMLFVSLRLVLLLPLTGFIVTIVAWAAKGWFAHDRPSTYFRRQYVFDQINVVQDIELHVGTTSFPSGHTMSAFALYGLMALFLYRKNALVCLFFTLAMLVGISRVYLVQHFLEDIVMGAAIGTTLAMLIYWLQSFLSEDKTKWYNWHF